MLETREPHAHPRDRLKRELRLRDATLLIVSGVIGSGIFLTPGPIAALLPHPGVILAAWFVGGLLSLAGAPAGYNPLLDIIACYQTWRKPSLFSLSPGREHLSSVRRGGASVMVLTQAG